MSNFSRQRIYLDHAATTPLEPNVLEAMQPFMTEVFGNPSSLHYYGRQVRKAMEAARACIAERMEAVPSGVVFTSGATEANNLAIRGVTEALADRGRHVITTTTEHASVANVYQWLERKGWSVTWLPVSEEGFVNPDAVVEAVRPDTVLVSILHGNNEIGTLQPVREIGERLRERGVPFHVDAVQTVGKVPVSLKALSADYLSLSAHKIYGPKGTGVLCIREGAPLPEPLLTGGGQEGGLRSGTENPAGVAGMAAALNLALERMPTETPRLRALQEWFIRAVMEAVPNAVLNGPASLDFRTPGNAHFSFPPGEGEALVLRLDLKGIAVSSGSACHSAVIEPSRVVKALGKPDDVARATVRFSMGRSTTRADLESVIAVLPDVLRRAEPAARKAI